MKKSKDLGKKNEGREFKKKIIVRKHFDDKFGNPIAYNYHNKLFMKVYNKEFAQTKLIQANDDGIKYYDIYNACFTKNDLIKEYDFFKKKEYKETQTWVFKKMTPEELKYWREELPKKFESETKDFIIKWFLSMMHYPVKKQYNKNPKYKALHKKMHKENKIVNNSLDF